MYPWVFRVQNYAHPDNAIFCYCVQLKRNISSWVLCKELLLYYWNHPAPFLMSSLEPSTLLPFCPQKNAILVKTLQPTQVQNLNSCFFEWTAQDSASFSIEIVEKYKTTVLEDHSQKKEKKRKNKTNLVGMGPQHGELHNSTLAGNSTPKLSPGWIEASNTGKHSKQPNKPSPA